MEYWEMITINMSATGAKEAVARLRKFLAADGINLKQTQAYEACASRAMNGPLAKRVNAHPQ